MKDDISDKDTHFTDFWYGFNKYSDETWLKTSPYNNQREIKGIINQNHLKTKIDISPIKKNENYDYSMFFRICHKKDDYIYILKKLLSPEKVKNKSKDKKLKIGNKEIHNIYQALSIKDRLKKIEIENSNIQQTAITCLILCLDSNPKPITDRINLCFNKENVEKSKKILIKNVYTSEEYTYLKRVFNRLLTFTDKKITEHNHV